PARRTGDQPRRNCADAAADRHGWILFQRIEKERIVGRLTSTQVRLLLLVPLSDTKIWHIDDLRKWLEDYVPLTAEDRKPYPGRPNEEIWYDTLDNALSPSRSTSLTATGKVKRVDAGYYQITKHGLEEADKIIEHLRNNNRGKIVDYLEKRRGANISE